MKRIAVAIGALVVPLAAVVACSSSSSSSGGTDAGDDSSTQDEPYVPNPANCVKPGATGNDKGVGAYCDPHTGCPTSSDSKVFLICTSIDPGTPSDKIFCTAVCKTDDDCGKNAFCAKDTAGSGCVPFACGDPPDASSDASADAANDAPSDG